MRRAICWRLSLASLGWLVLSAVAVQAQYFPYNQPIHSTPLSQQLPTALVSQAPAAPATSQTPQQPSQPAPSAQPSDAAQPNDLAQNNQSQDPGSERSGAVGGESFAAADGNAGYIDPARPRTRFRTRFDAAYGNNQPDRAAFFYPKCGCYRDLPGPFNDPSASGPPLPETNVDYQDFNSYMEYAMNDRFSMFLDVPYRFINPEQNRNAKGFSNLNAGFKYAFLAEQDQYLTFQFKTDTPTGDGGLGLGNDHVSLEPALLYFRQLSDQLALESEFRYWIPIGGGDFAGQILRYGAGLGYTVFQNDDWRVTPIMEWVGWTVLSGKESVPAPVVQKDAAGDTIVNGKFGVRTRYQDRHNVYLGYGRAVTGAVWYKDLLRVEYRLDF